MFSNPINLFSGTGVASVSSSTISGVPLAHVAHAVERQQELSLGLTLVTTFQCFPTRVPGNSWIPWSASKGFWDFDVSQNLSYLDHPRTKIEWFTPFIIWLWYIHLNCKVFVRYDLLYASRKIRWLNGIVWVQRVNWCKVRLCRHCQMLAGTMLPDGYSAEIRLKLCTLLVQSVHLEQHSLSIIGCFVLKKKVFYPKM